MRYFKYKNTDKNLNRALKEHYNSLTVDEKRTVRKEKRWSIFSSIISTIVFLLFVIAGTYAITLIPQTSWWLWDIFVTIAKVIIGIILLAISGILTFVLTKPLWRKVESFNLPQMKKEIFSKCCAHLRQHYGLQEPYILTKCFDCTDEKFKNHDVCIFVVNDELRITTDLINGFLYGERDLGCYVFKRDEIVLSKLQDGKHLIAQLQVGNTIFKLGYRAKGFIQRNLISKQPA